jgi:uncharacterized protein (TIGR04255 family)
MKQLNKSPLAMVLAQVKFAPVLQIQKYIPELQEILRKRNYPQFVEEQVQEFVFAVGNTNLPPVQNSSRWIFGSSDWKNTIVISQDFVVIETSEYHKFERFSEEFKNVLNIIKDTVSLTRSERVGLRYVNLIRSDKAKNSQLFLRQELRGLGKSDIEGVSGMQGSCVSHAVTVHGRLMIRAVHIDDGSHIPPELASTKLNFAYKPSKGEQVSILDIDHNGEFTSDFEVDRIIAKLSELHDFSDNAFLASVTTDALKEWS